MIPQYAREALLAKVAEDTHDIVIVTDANGLTLWVNEAFGKLTGYNLSEIAGRKPGHLLQGRATDRKTIVAIARALQAKRSIKTQILNYTKSGLPIWLDIEISPMFDDAAHLTGFIAIQRDISESVKRQCDLSHAALGKRKAENRLRAAINAASDGFAIYDENDRLVMANGAFIELHKGIEDKITPGVTFEELLRYAASEGLLDIGEGDLETWIARHKKARRLPSSETHVRFRDGRWMSWHHQRMETNEVVGIWSDITSLKQQQAQLEEARARAEAADRAKSQFLTNTSHEIRTPLNGIIGFNDLLLRTDLTETQREFAQLILSSSKSLLSLIDELLDLGKVEKGILELEAAPFKLDELVSAAHALQALAKHKSLNLQIECSLPKDTTVVGDLKRIRQILTNLLGNAIKFTEKGQVKLSISREDKTLLFVVTDTGSGIPPEGIEAIFDRFYRVGEPRLGKVQGCGLGLAIAKDLVTIMGGEINVTSEIGRGSTFEVRLPICLAAEKAHHASSGRPPRPVPTNANVACAYRVLIAEDHPINLKLVLALLEAAGCQTESVRDGRQALAKLDRSDFDLIIMDSQMPVMNGLEAITVIRSRRDWKRHVPILSLTADAMKGADEYHTSAGANLYMSKPLRSDCFIGAVKHLAEQGRDLRRKNAIEPARVLTGDVLEMEPHR
jgi:two-component system, sensor histidine kinase